MHRTGSSLFAVVGLAISAAAPGQSLAANLTTLVSFCALANCADGVHPEARLVADDDGNLFGATVLGGVNGQGTVFEIVNNAGSRGHDGGRLNLHRPGVPDYASTPTTLVSFCALANCADGALPNGLIGDAKGNLFGTTSIGGSTNGQGTVFEISKTISGYASSPTTLVSFCSLPNCVDGANPTGGLIADAKGNLFGTTGNGGANVVPGAFGGTVFEIVNNAQGRAHDADRRNHRHPGPDYASTATPLASFCALANCADGALPRGGLVADADGNLFGTTYTGGANDGGTVFEIVKTASGYASTVSTLVSFCALANCADGATPNAGLILDAKGNLFGTTFGGGANGRGTVFEIVKTASGYASSPTILVSFCVLPNCADGAAPQGDLIADAKGNLFGTTSSGGTGNNGGTVFEIVHNARSRDDDADRRNHHHHPGLPDYASTPTTLVSFCALANCADGSEPLAGLIADARGNLFGTTFGGGTGTANTGGAVSGGTVFQITDSGFVVPHKFDGAPGQPNCFGQSVSALATKFGGLISAADDLGHPSVRALQDAILEFCEG